jgi:hypothetical protein
MCGVCTKGKSHKTKYVHDTDRQTQYWMVTCNSCNFCLQVFLARIEFLSHKQSSNKGYVLVTLAMEEFTLLLFVQ